MTEVFKLARCTRCGAAIHLVKGGRDRNGVEWFRWVTDLKKPKDTWRCQPTREFPVRSHSSDESVS